MSKMKKYVYVVTYYATEEDAKEKLISFRHVIVMAWNPDAVYNHIDKFLPFKIPQGMLVNDYVANITEDEDPIPVIKEKK